MDDFSPLGRLQKAESYQFSAMRRYLNAKLPIYAEIVPGGKGQLFLINWKVRRRVQISLREAHTDVFPTSDSREWCRGCILSGVDVGEFTIFLVKGNWSCGMVALPKKFPRGYGKNCVSWTKNNGHFYIFRSVDELYSIIEENCYAFHATKD